MLKSYAMTCLIVQYKTDTQRSYGQDACWCWQSINFLLHKKSCVYGYPAACAKPKQSNQVGSLEFLCLVYSSSTLFFLGLQHLSRDFSLYVAFLIQKIKMHSLTMFEVLIPKYQ